MKLIFILTGVFLMTVHAVGQGLVKIGDQTPSYNFNTLVNAPLNQINLSELHNKPAVIAFWGTWCSPCIPEMINLGKLQKRFGDKVQIMGVSNDSEQKLKFFYQNGPAKFGLPRILPITYGIYSAWKKPGMLY